MMKIWYFLGTYTCVSPAVHEGPGSAGVGQFIHLLTHSTNPSWELMCAGCYMVPVLMDLGLGKWWDITIIVMMAPDGNDNHPSYGKSTAQGSLFSAY